MATASESDLLFVERIERGEEAAWRELIARFEGRLLAFVEGRTSGRSAAEDVVQETFLGFLTSLPNYDRRRPLEGYLFSIAAHKLTDHLRREGRRPTLPLDGPGAQSSQRDAHQPASPAMAASSVARSGERRALEALALTQALEEHCARLRSRGEWQKLTCLELLFLRSWPNREVAARLEMTEQAVAGLKFECITRLRSLLRRQSLPEDVFPELGDG